MYQLEIIVSNRESGMQNLAEQGKREGNYIIEVFLSDPRFDIWIWGLWPSLQGLTMIGPVYKLEERIEERRK